MRAAHAQLPRPPPRPRPPRGPRAAVTQRLFVTPMALPRLPGPRARAVAGPGPEGGNLTVNILRFERRVRAQEGPRPPSCLLERAARLRSAPLRFRSARLGFGLVSVRFGAARLGSGSARPGSAGAASGPRARSRVRSGSGRRGRCRRPAGPSLSPPLGVLPSCSGSEPALRPSPPGREGPPGAPRHLGLPGKGRAASDPARGRVSGRSEERPGAAGPGARPGGGTNKAHGERGRGGGGSWRRGAVCAPGAATRGDPQGPSPGSRGTWAAEGAVGRPRGRRGVRDPWLWVR